MWPADVHHSEHNEGNVSVMIDKNDRPVFIRDPGSCSSASTILCESKGAASHGQEEKEQ